MATDFGSFLEVFIDNETIAKTNPVTGGFLPNTGAPVTPADLRTYLTNETKQVYFTPDSIAKSPDLINAALTVYITFYTAWLMVLYPEGIQPAQWWLDGQALLPKSIVQPPAPFVMAYGDGTFLSAGGNWADSKPGDITMFTGKVQGVPYTNLKLQFYIEPGFFPARKWREVA